MSEPPGTAAGAVLGIDVGCSAVRRSSAACLLEWTSATVAWRLVRFRAAEPERGDAIAALAGDGPLAAAALDGPLRRGFDVIGRYRQAERLLTVRLGRRIGKPGQSSAPVGRMLNAHANACAAIVLARTALASACHAEAIDARAIVEAFPGAFMGAMIADPAALGATRANRSDRFFTHLAANGGFARLLAALLPDRAPGSDPVALTNHDDRAAFVCALSALCVARGRYSAVGDPDDGWIVLPPQSFIQPAIRAALAANAADGRGGEVRMSGVAELATA